jgi:hypothetical protein
MRLFTVVIVGLLLGSSAAGAQSPRRKGERPPRADADPLAAQQRATAVLLLTALAEKTRNFRDVTLRARAQARAADAFWESDAELARTLFRRAWADADAGDREIERKREEDRTAQLASGGVAMQSAPPELRAEVLRLAGRRDRALGEEFLALLARPDEKESAQAGAGDSPYGISPAELQRLGLTLKLLEEGDTARAVQFAEPALGRASIPSLRFLSALREKDAASADKLFTTLVARAAADPDSDANTVSLLVSYVFTPFKYFTSYKTSGTGTSSGKDNPRAGRGAGASRLLPARRGADTPAADDAAGVRQHIYGAHRLLHHHQAAAPALRAARARPYAGAQRARRLAPAGRTRAPTHGRGRGRLLAGEVGKGRPEGRRAGGARTRRAHHGDGRA